MTSLCRTTQKLAAWVPSVEKQCIFPIDFWKIAKK